MPSLDETTRHGFPWSRDEEKFVYDAFCKGASPIEIASSVRRRVGGIRARLKRLGLLDDAGVRVKPRPAFTPYADKLASDDLRFDGLNIEALPEARGNGATQPAWPIEGFPDCELLSPRAQATLKTAGFATVQEVIECDARRLLRIPNCGRKTLREIKEAAEENARAAAIAAQSVSGEPNSVHETVVPPEEAEVPLPPLTQEEFERGVAEMVEDMADQLAELLTELEEGDRDDRIFAARFAIDPDDIRTLADLGDECGVSRERIRQIERKGLKRWPLKLCPHAERRSIRAFVDRKGVQKRSEFHEYVARRIEQTDMSSPAKCLLLSIFIKALSEGGPTQYKALKQAGAVFRDIQKADRREQRERRRQEQTAQLVQEADDWVRAICDATTWPGAGAPDLSVLKALEYRREADETDFGDLDLFESNKLGRPVAYESRDELKALEVIDRSTLVEHFDAQCMKLSYRDQGRERAYHPDIVMRFSDGRCLVLEIKDPRVMATYPVLAKAFHMRRKLRPFGVGYHVTSFQGHTIERLRRLRIDEQVQRRFLHELDKAGSLVARRVFEVVADLYRGEHSVYDALQAIVLQHGLAFYERPFRVMRGDGHDRQVFA